MISYALKSALLLTLFYGGFSVLLSRETFHRFNRMVLLAIVLLSLVLPTVHVTMRHPLPLVMEPYVSVQAAASEAVGREAAEPLPETSGAATLEEAKGHPLRGKDVWGAVYVAGLLAALARFVLCCVRLARSLRGGLRSRDAWGNTVVIKSGAFPPFSFMHWIVVSVDDYEHHRQSILTHERAHVRLGHSWDLLLLEVVQVVQWFNPFAWLLGRELRAVHEYEADEAVICQGIDAKQYQQLLVIKAVGNRLQLFANTLNRGSLKQRITMMQQKKSSRWRMLRAAFAIPVATLAVVATASTTPPLPGGEAAGATPLVEYRLHQKWGKGHRDYYLVHLPEGVWVEGNGASHIEEQFFTYSFDDTRSGKVNNRVVMMLDGVPFDQNSLPTLSSDKLRKMEINMAKGTGVEYGANGKMLSTKGQHTTVNLVTTPVSIPAGVEGNVPRVQTLLLPGKGKLYIKNGKATPGDWMHCSITDWEPTSYGYSVRNEFERSKTKPGFKCYIYASTETAERDVSRAEALMRELGISNYEVVRGLPKRHFTDSELRQWALGQKAKGTPYDRLFDAMAPNRMDCEDVRRQWHVVKAVYGIKANAKPSAK